MKKLLLYPLSLLVALPLVVNPARAATGLMTLINEVQDSSFMPTSAAGPSIFSPWSLNTKSGATADLQVDTSTSVSGGTSARIDVTKVDGTFWGIQLHQITPIATGQTYKISFWAKASVSGSFPIGLQQAISPYTAYFTGIAPLTSSWQQFTFQYASTATDPGALLHLDAGSRLASVWLDDVVVSAQAPTPPPAPFNYFRGVNLKGGDQGLYSTADGFADAHTLDWLKSKGLTTFRVPFAWAHLQPAYGTAFNPTYLAMMDSLVAAAKARGEHIAFVPMDRRSAPVSAFVDLWTRLAAHYVNESAIWGYDLMNEPTGDNWNTDTAPAIIAAIRLVDMSHTIVVETSTGGWGQYWAAHTVGLPMRDPANNLLYEAHFYFDTPANGQYPNGTAFDVPGSDLNVGVERAAPFVAWCKANAVHCYAGEYGVPGGWTSGNATCTNGTPQTDPRWLTVLDNFLTYLDQNRISGTYWEAGPFGDVNDLGPTCSGQDRPQMAILQRHLGSV